MMKINIIWAVICLVSLLYIIVLFGQGRPTLSLEERFYQVAKLLPYNVTRNMLFEHSSIYYLGRQVQPSLVLPKYFKYKESLLVPIRTQGSCASCWAFAVADMLGDRVSLLTRGRTKQSLSVQELVSCLRPELFQCSRGGIPEMAYPFIEKKGLSKESAYPYENIKGGDIAPCKTSRMQLWDYVMPSSKKQHDRDRVFVKPGTTRNLCLNPDLYTKSMLSKNIENMKTEIFLHGPIVGTLMVYDDLYRYDGESVYTVSPNAVLRGGHAIEIFGWSDEGQNTDEAGFQGAYWICRNSWGHIWPRELPQHNAGWFYVRMGTNEAQIESRASAAQPMATNDRTSTWSSNAYTSYDAYVNDPERQNFFSHLKVRRQQRQRSS